MTTETSEQMGSDEVLGESITALLGPGAQEVRACGRGRDGAQTPIHPGKDLRPNTERQVPAAPLSPPLQGPVPSPGNFRRSGEGRG